MAGIVLSSRQEQPASPSAINDQLKVVCDTGSCDAASLGCFPPINFFYSHLHNSIRSELDALGAAVLALEPEQHPAEGGVDDVLTQRLTYLKERYRFLENVYKYHSNVEDEVVYPALDAKVRNVTLAYSVEHEDEERLFEELSGLIAGALAQQGAQRSGTLRELVCKVEAVHTTMRKHLAKEEEQLLPLLLAHFSHAEQASLVAQFLCCIPLAAVDEVLGWIKATVPHEEQRQLLQHVQRTVSDQPLLQLLQGWLSPLTSGGAAALPPLRKRKAPDCSFTQPLGPIKKEQGQRQQQDGSEGDGAGGGGGRLAVPPLRDLVHLHTAIRSALNVFVEDARALTKQGSVSAAQLSSLVEKHRFARAVCTFHSASEDEVLFPAARQLSASLSPSRARSLSPPPSPAAAAALAEADANNGVSTAAASPTPGSPLLAADKAAGEAHLQQQGQAAGEAADADPQQPAGEPPPAAGEALSVDDLALPNACTACEADHAAEAALFEDLGRLLADVKACTRRGARHAAELTEELCRAAETVQSAIGHHMNKEEVQVLPVLEAGMGVQQQRSVVWHTLRAMPLRLLERVMPSVAGKLSEDEASELLNNMRLAAPDADSALVELLSRWATQGRQQQQQQQHLDGEAAALHQTTTPAGLAEARSAPLAEPAEVVGGNASSVHPRKKGQGAEAGPLPPSPLAGSAPLAAAVAAAVGGARAPKRARQSPSSHPQLQGTTPAASSPFAGGSSTAPAAQDGGGSEAAGGGAEPVGGLLRPGGNPIDHIFQFHKGLRRELRELEAAATALEAAVVHGGGGASWSHDADVQALEGQFTFLWGIYQAHSKAEDEIVFPALEGKEALLNISHAYTLDHQQESQLFTEVGELFRRIRSASGAPRTAMVAQLRRMCAGIRASLETHVRAEENELWPVFAEHFSEAEQHDLVGQIIGRTGAEVLQVMLPWVTGSITPEEQEAMMVSLRSATRNTMFNLWLDATLTPQPQQRGALQPCPSGVASSAPSQQHQPGEPRPGPPGRQVSVAESDTEGSPLRGRDTAAGAAAREGGPMDPILAEALHYIRQEQQQQPGGGDNADGADGGGTAAASASGAAQQGAAEPETGGVLADSKQYRPGWDDLFRMNEQQLQAAVRRVSSDTGLEPQRKSYIIQHIMTSRYIAAQQRRMAEMYGVATTSSAGGSGAGAGAAAAAAGADSSGAVEQQEAQAHRQPKEHQCGDADGGPAPGSSPGHHHQQHHHHHHACAAPAAATVAAHAAAGAAAAAAGRAAAGVVVPTATYHDPVRRVLGCKHYKRAARLVAPCCGRVFTCRLCHDECVADHRMDRYAVSEMVCMHCGVRQPVAGACSSCAASMSAYYCGICHLFDDEPGRDIYHCPFCNVCRRGKGLGKDFFHCMNCNCCMALDLANRHRCQERSLECACPVCNEYLMDSSLAVKELPCGHFMHSACFSTYTRHSYTCPVCSRSLGDMSVYWRMLDSLLAAEPRAAMPPGYATRRQSILCNDCGVQGDAPFHFVYHQCASCKGYNTRVTG